MASGARGREQVYANGDTEGGMWWAGQAQGLIDSIDSCAGVVAAILDDARALVTTTLPATLSA
jgi:nitronate monooxygenase